MVGVGDRVAERVLGSGGAGSGGSSAARDVEAEEQLEAEAGAQEVFRQRAAGVCCSISTASGGREAAVDEAEERTLVKSMEQKEVEVGDGQEVKEKVQWEVELAIRQRSSWRQEKEAAGFCYSRAAAGGGRGATGG